MAMRCAWKAGLAAAGMLLAASAAATGAERILADGEEGALSPDGKMLLFQRWNGKDYDVGMRELSSGRERWVCAGEGQAFQPAWAPDGSVVYSYGHMTNTAYEIATRGIDAGFRLYRWKEGVVERLTSGRHHDYAASVAVDGTLWFTSTRCEKGSRYDLLNRVWLFRLPPGEHEPIAATGPQSHWSAGAVSPRVSPDGRILLWTQAEGFLSTWHLYAAAVENGLVGVPMRLTPGDMYAYSPNWHPDGRHIVFGGYREGDPAWGVWMLEPVSGKMRRVADGTNPSFAPDGGSVVYDRGGRICIRSLDDGDLPPAAPVAGVRAAVHGDVVFSVTNPASGASFPLPPSAAFGRGEFWVRAKFALGKDNERLRTVFEASYAEHPAGIQMHLPAGKNEIVFASRSVGGHYQFVHRTGDLTPGLMHEFVGIRRGDDLFLSMDGLPPERAHMLGRALSLDTPKSLSVGSSFTGKLVEISMGHGRPQGFTGAITVEDLFMK